MINNPVRCSWISKFSTPLDIEYHDKEWGVPVHDDKKFFEFLILEGAQAGLSWQTILKKRKNYRKAFDNFDPEKVAQYKQEDTNRLLKDEGIVRNRLKISSSIVNAQNFLKVQKEFGSFDKYIWTFVGGKTIRDNSKIAMPTTKESDMMSKDLKKRGFKFVGSTICYAFMQATGLVDDHSKDCFKSTK